VFRCGMKGKGGRNWPRIRPIAEIKTKRMKGLVASGTRGGGVIMG